MSPEPATDPATKRATKSVPRHRVVNRLLSLYDQPRYLEVGVHKGVTFDLAAAPVKVAVDPVFAFEWDAPERRVPGVSYHQVPSDEYFGTIVDPKERFDVIYLDGLHTLEQTLRDLLNALHHLQPQGTILIDDVRPPTYHSSLPDRDGFVAVRSYLNVPDKAWMGDVYRLVYFIDTFCQQLTYRTVGNNHGQAVVWRQRRAEVTERTVAEVGTLDFAEFVLAKDVLRTAPLGKIIGQLKAALAAKD